MFIVYILKSKSTNKRYIGQTKDLRKRIVTHNSGLSKYTKNRGPWELIYSESYKTRSEAIIREKYLKSGIGREFLDNLPK